MSFTRQRLLIEAYFVSLCVKLIIAPWSTGVYLNPVGQLLNNLCDATWIVATLIGAVYIFRAYKTVFVPAIVVAISYCLSTVLYTDESALSFLSWYLKVFIPLLAAPVIWECSKQEKALLLSRCKFLVVLIAALVFIGLAFLPNIMNRLVSWSPAYFSGLHSTAYVACMSAILVHALYKHQHVSIKLFMAYLAVVFIFVYQMWGVRTASLLLISFYLINFLMNSKLGRYKLSIYIPYFFAAMLVLLLFVDMSIINSTSSGRISMYIDKYEQLMENDVLQWLIGNGYKSDLIATDIWWWALKGAHSDVITMLVEGGVIFLASFLYILNQYYSNGNSFIKCLIIAAMVSALFSNGVFVRPIAGYIFSFCLVLFMIEREKDNEVAVGR